MHVHRYTRTVSAERPRHPQLMACKYVSMYVCMYVYIYIYIYIYIYTHTHTNRYKPPVPSATQAELLNGETEGRTYMQVAVA